MKILSFDVGIKNLSLCLLEIVNGDTATSAPSAPSAPAITILKWDNVNLAETTDYVCVETDKKGICGKPGKYKKDTQCYCLKHFKKIPHYNATLELSPSFIKKQQLQSLIGLCDKYNITYTTPARKAQLTNALIEYSVANCFTVIQLNNATKANLVTIGRNIQTKLDIMLSEHLATIPIIIIENQIGPIANKMKTIQGMLAQYFIMRNANVEVEFISAGNKLKDFLQDKEVLNYKQRKQLAVTTSLNIISSSECLMQWVDFFTKHSKKDDLADCFLQGIWFLRHKVQGAI